MLGIHLGTARVGLGLSVRIWNRGYSELVSKTQSKTRFSLANLKIGRAVDVAHHPNADTMYVSQIDVTAPGGAATVRQVCSGLRAYVGADALEGSLVVVVDNLKKCKLRGEVSEAMLLCGEDTVQGIVVPCRPALGAVDAASLVGKQVILAGSAGEVAAETRRLKRAEWEELASRLSVDADHRVVFWDPEAGKTVPLCVLDGEREVGIVVDSVGPGSAVC
ncbi:LADA_0H11408g1_1 [Lachancea dasiensis]|uniref:LADA_0H11408g1_1 n=1 Tax=Lachancea dasiensis TaxID=1072105 RepID=A0A1G4K3E7_9SACH|nr:LADA_0H11408g1_1 [Lachancea dasiensis]